jgi:nucleotide-binding universal stress UspA family protein
VGGVVVGTKRNQDSTSVVSWAATEASRRGLGLHLVHAWDEPLDVSIEIGPEDLPDLYSVTTACAVHGPAAVVLLAGQPDLLVLGARTVSRHVSHLTRVCLHHASCPVVVVPGGERAVRGRVLVGAGCTQASRNALRWAAEAARLRRAQLVVVHAWQAHPASARDVLQPARSLPAQQSAAMDRLHAWVRGTLGNVDAELHATHGGPVDALLALSADADLLVLGRSTHFGLGRALHGAVGEDLTALAPCPIAVVPPAGS